ncbi:hypothetical protein SteCoe_3021 [Stentor coeruleus]|uniref:Uncharacterized protein n=1 Tax=Stentor coeruleus TaxID=5963 RepID=A0A1R2CY62_9CILI|nr:hypothetical protein SteCoe_3021 [Stentor coeruleus]
MLSTNDFSLKKFSDSFSPRIPETAQSGYMKLIRLISMTLQNIHEMTKTIIETSARPSARSSPTKSFQSIDKEKYLSFRNNPVYEQDRFQMPKFDGDIKDITEITYEIEDFERRILENLDMVKDVIRVYSGNMKVSNEDFRSGRIISKSMDIEIIQSEKNFLIKENDMLRQEMNQLKLNWSSELESARIQWNKGLDNMQMTYEANMKELINSHNIQIEELKHEHKEKYQNTHSTFKETENKYIEKIEAMNEDQAEMFKKFTNKINFLTSKNNEDNAFIDSIYNRIEDIFGKYDLIERYNEYTSLREKIICKLDDIAAVFEKNKGNLKKCTKSEAKASVSVLKEKLVENSVILKDFEEARSKLVKHFVDDSGKKIDVQYPLTTRY